MSGQRLSRGMKIEWNSFEFLIEERLSNRHLRLLNKHTTERRTVEETELIKANSDGGLKIIGHIHETRNLEGKIRQNHVFDFTALDDADPRKIAALKRFEYLKELLSGRKSGFSQQEIAEVIGKVSKRINDSSPPSVRTVQRWISPYVKAAEDIRVLVDADKSKGNRKRKFSTDAAKNQEVVEVISNCINEIFLTPQQNTKRAASDLVEYRINKLNEYRSEGNKLPLPTYKSICRIIAQLDEYEVDKARKGERFANEKHKILHKGPEPTRPLERVECDDTQTDLLVVDQETGLPLGRPWLMVLVDVFTKMILGYFVSFYPPSHVTVMMAMKHAIRPKSYVKEKYPDIVNSWATYGLIEVLVIDNAKHWYGKGLEDACFQMGTDMQFAPVRIPWYKGAVERLLQTIHSDLIHQQPGTTFSNIFEKGDYDPQKHAVIWLDLLDEILHKWIVDVYSQDIHTGINDIPARRWKNSIIKYPPALPPAHTDLDIILGKVAYRKLSGTVIYAGSRLLSTFTNNGSGGETLEFQHPDRLGTRLVTNDTANTSFEQTTLPFGTELAAETTGTTNERFTSYDRSTVANLDYAVNRSYSSGQGRFTQVDPLGAGATSIGNPQSNNLYAYAGNNPIDFTDPSGLLQGPPREGCKYDNETGKWVCPPIEIEFGWMPYEGPEIQPLPEGIFDSFGGGGGGQHEQGHNTGPKAQTPTKTKFYECLNKTFGKGVDLQSVVPSDNGSQWIAQMTYKGNPFVVKTSLVRSDSVDLAKQLASGSGLKYKEGDRESGLTSNSSMLDNIINNDIASDVTVGTFSTEQYNQIGYMALYYHELGNAIALYIYSTGGSSNDPFHYSNVPKGQDPDAGAAFEKCLFGNIVSLTNGRTGTKRDW